MNNPSYTHTPFNPEIKWTAQQIQFKQMMMSINPNNYTNINNINNLNSMTANMAMSLNNNMQLNHDQYKQNQQSQFEYKKVWIGKIPEGVTEIFILKLLEACGPVSSWKRVSDSKGKWNSFGICEYVTVEGLLKCLRLLNNFSIDNSKLQAKIGREAEESVRKWRWRKKYEWIESLKVRGVVYDINEINRKEENGEPLEWEIELVSKDNETWKLLYDIMNQRKDIENYARQIERPEWYLKDWKELAAGTLATTFESERERERFRKKAENQKKMEKAFKDEERKWLKHEEDKEKEFHRLKYEKEFLKNKIQRLINKNLNYDTDEENHKISLNPRKYQEHVQLRLKEKEYDDHMREKENKILFQKDIKEPAVTSLATLPKEKEATTKIVIEDYQSDSGGDLDINHNRKNVENIEWILDRQPIQKVLNKINVHNIEDEEDDPYTRKKISHDIINIPIENDHSTNFRDTKEMLKLKAENEEYITNLNKEVQSINDLVKWISQDRFIEIQKGLITVIPKEMEELFQYPIDYDWVVRYNVKKNQIKPWLDKKLWNFFDDVDSFTALILDKIGKNSPFEILDTLKSVWDDEANVIFVLIY